MRNLSTAAILLGPLLAVSAFAAPLGEGWRWMWPVDADIEERAFVQLPLTPSIVDGAAPDLRDLRLVDGDGRAAPYVLQAPGARDNSELIEISTVEWEVFVDGPEQRVAIDLGMRNLPVQALDVEIADALFHRPAQLLGRGGAEDGWATIRRGRLYRVLENGDSARERTAFTDLKIRFRFLEVRIDNGDNPPLDVTDVTVKRRADLGRLVFEYTPGQEYRLYGGNPAAEAPDYDLARAAAPLLREPDLPAVQAGERVRVDGARARPWTERYGPAVLWAALVAAAAILAFAVRRGWSGDAA